jgi:hypothetical protein
MAIHPRRPFVRSIPLPFRIIHLSPLVRKPCRGAGTSVDSVVIAEPMRLGHGSNKLSSFDAMPSNDTTPPRNEARGRRFVLPGGPGPDQSAGLPSSSATFWNWF